MHKKHRLKLFLCLLCLLCILWLETKRNEREVYWSQETQNAQETQIVIDFVSLVYFVARQTTNFRILKVGPPKLIRSPWRKDEALR
jgi:hypothetical protein